MTDVLDTPADLGELPHSPRWPLDVEPWAHQAEAFAFAMERPGTLLAISMGGGKTLTSAAVIEATDATPALVLCPLSVVGTWRKEIAKWLPGTRVWSGEVHGARGPLKSPTVAQRAVAISDAYTDALRLGKRLVVVVNYEASWPKAMAQILQGIPWRAVVCDESHRIKSPSGKASRLAARVAWKVRERGGKVLALTGTPMPHSAFDAWAQMRVLDGGERFGTNFHSHQRRYGAGETIYAAGGVARTVYKDLNQPRREQFYRLLGDVTYQVTQDALDAMLGLPETVDLYRTCELRPETRRAYAALEADLIAEIGEDTVTAANAMVLTTRLAQVSGGFSRGVDGQMVAISDPPEKAALLGEVLEDLATDEPVVVFARFHQDLDNVRAAAERTGRRYGELSGRRRDGLTEHSTMAPGVDVLGAQLRSGGVGIDLTRARYGIYYSLDWSLGDYLQSRKRLHRPGQTRRTTYVHLAASDTLDETCLYALRHRRDVVESILAAIRGRQKGTQ